MFKAQGDGAKVGVGGIANSLSWLGLRRWDGNVIHPWKFIDNVTSDLYEGTKPKVTSK